MLAHHHIGSHCSTSDQRRLSQWHLVPSVVKWMDVLCFRCAGRQQQHPEPVGVRQWHHRSDGTRVKGTQLSGLPALLRGAPLVWRAEATPHSIRLTRRCFGHVPCTLSGHAEGEKKRKASQYPQLVLLERIDRRVRHTLALHIAARHWCVIRLFYSAFINFKFLLLLLFFLFLWVSVGSEKTATKLQSLSVETKPEWRAWVHEEFLWVEGRGVIACKAMLLVSYWFNVIVLSTNEGV